jgi:hypothetical protein
MSGGECGSLARSRLGPSSSQMHNADLSDTWTQEMWGRFLPEVLRVSRGSALSGWKYGLADKKHWRSLVRTSREPLATPTTTSDIGKVCWPGVYILVKKRYLFPSSFWKCYFSPLATHQFSPPIEPILPKFFPILRLFYPFTSHFLSFSSHFFLFL